MSYAAQSDRYRETDILSRPKEWLVPLLYEHLLVSLNRAAAQIEVRDLEGKGASLEKANSILIELLTSLNVEQGGEIASRLSALYTYLAGELLTVSRTMDVHHLRRLIAIVEDLHGAWVQAAQGISPRPGRV